MKQIKLLVILQTIVLLLNCITVPTAANVNINTMSGDSEIAHRIEHKDISERISDITTSNKYTSAQKLLGAGKLRAKLIEKDNIVRADYSYTLDVPYQGQWENYYCGPATVRQTLLFYGVSNAPSQSDIADDLNVTAALGVPDAGYMIDYINSYIPDESPYFEEHPEDIEDMILSFKVACKSFGPPILRIMANSTTNWPYPTGGHFLNVSGAYKSGSYYSFQLTDPYIGWVTNNTTGKYTDSAEDVYSVVMLHWFGGYWW